MGNFYSYYVFLREFFTFLTTFWQISAQTHELLPSILCFFLLSNYRNIEYRFGEFKKLLDYRISDQGLNLSDNRISDSEKTIGCPPLLYTKYPNTLSHTSPHIGNTCLLYCLVHRFIHISCFRYFHRISLIS
jgi:hypothetical protein